MKRKKIGIFGGTFNPVHIGHIVMAEAVRKEYKLDKVYFIPCGVPPHKPKQKLLPAKFRYDLVSHAIKKKKCFKVLDIEIKKKKPAYTIETVDELERKMKHSDFYFLIGADEFEKLHTWNKANKLAKMVAFLVLPRLSKNIKIPKVKNLKWSLVHTKPVNISSSEIRKRIKEKKPIKNLIPSGVKNFY